MALVTLVVVGHSLVIVKNTAFAYHLYDFIYAWHMPAFVLVAGYLSRTFSYSRARLWALVRGVAVPYIVVDTAISIFTEVVNGDRISDLWVVPHWPMWFLPALFAWRLATPVMKRLGPASITVAIGLSLVGGYVGTDYLDVRRILGFLPFFALGLCLTPELLARLRTAPARIAAVAALAGIWVLTGLTDRLAETRWLLYTWPYDRISNAYPAVITRAGLLVVGLLGAFAVLALVPRVRGWFTRMGAASLVVYLCHGFVVKGVEGTRYDDWGHAHPVIALPLTILGAVGVALLLASPPVARRLERVIDPLGYAEARFDDTVRLHAGAGPVLSRDQREPVHVGA
jgi:fucose 4-O-acetylase-like acetyltransferase